MSGRSRCHLRPRGSGFALLVVALWLTLMAVAAPAMGQDQPVDANEVVEFDARETEGEIQAIRWTLVGIAIVTGAMLVLYVWHTNPHRRVRAARYRKEWSDARRADTGDAAFLLPADLEATPPSSGRTSD